MAAFLGAKEDAVGETFEVPFELYQQWALHHVGEEGDFTSRIAVEGSGLGFPRDRVHSVAFEYARRSGLDLGKAETTIIDALSGPCKPMFFGKFKPRVFEFARTVPIYKPPTPDLAALRRDLSERMREVLSRRRPGLYLFRHPTGTGKTYIACKEIEAHYDEFVRLGLRVAYLIKRHKDMEDAIKWMPHAVPQIGRQIEPDSPGYCKRFSEYTRAARAGRNTSEICGAACPHRMGCPYLKQADAAKNATIVVAPYSVVLDSLPRLREFDVIVVDESLIDQLVSIRKLDTHCLDDWRRGVEELKEPDPRFMPALNILRQMLDETSSFLPNECRSAYDRWQELTGGAYEALIPVGRKPFPFEQSEKGVHDVDSIPKRMFGEMLRALHDPRQRAVLTAGKTTEKRVTRGTLDFATLKDEVVGVLKEKVVISLDATPCLPLLGAVFGTMALHGPEQMVANARITQVFDRIYRRDSLLKGSTLLSHYTELWTKQARSFANPLLFTWNNFNPPGEKKRPKSRKNRTEVILDLPSGTKVAHFGVDDHSTNDYENADAIILAGNFQPSGADIILKANAVRREAPASISTTQRLRQFPLIGTDGKVWYRAARVYEDELLQEVADHAVTSNVIQSIGRARPLSRSTPLPVFIINGAIYEVPIDELIHRTAILEKRKRPEKQTRGMKWSAFEHSMLVVDAWHRGIRSIRAIEAETGVGKSQVSKILEKTGLRKHPSMAEITFPDALIYIRAYSGQPGSPITVGHLQTTKKTLHHVLIHETMTFTDGSV